MLKIKRNHNLTIPKKVSQKIIYFEWCCDINPFPPNECPIFTNAETVILSMCDKNFLHWLKPELFPKLKTVYTDVLHDNEIFKLENVKIYCSNDHYYNKHKRFAESVKFPTSAELLLIDKQHFKTFIQLANDINRE